MDETYSRNRIAHLKIILHNPRQTNQPNPEAPPCMTFA